LVATLSNALGIAPERFAALASGGSLFPPWAAAKLEKIMQQRTAETEFPLRWAHKDVLLALAPAGRGTVAAPDSQHKLGRCDTEFGADDLSAISLALQQQLGGMDSLLREIGGTINDHATSTSEDNEGSGCG
jgi:3-hydroxyisobutyrate dehydrogenase-like beta-hydroxyacid dehydrogenase